MSDTAEVTLQANDAISTPALKAIAAMQQLQAALGDVIKASQATGSATAQAASGVKDLGEASDRAVVPHRAAHQAMNLLSGAMSEVAGASRAAEGGVRVLDSVMFTAMMTGGAMSGAFIILAGAATAIGVAMGASFENTKKEREELERMVKAGEDAALAAERLNAQQRSMAAVGAAEAGRKMDDLTQKVNAAKKEWEALGQVVTTSDPIFSETGQVVGHTTNTVAANGQQIFEARKKYEALKAALAEATEQYKAFHAASAGVGKSDRNPDTAAKAAADAMKKADELRLESISHEKASVSTFQALFGSKEQARLASLNKELAAVKSFHSQSDEVQQSAAKRSIVLQSQVAEAREAIRTAEIKSAWAAVGNLMDAAASMLVSEAQKNSKLAGLAIAFIAMQKAMAIAAVIASAAATGGWIGFLMAVANIGVIAMQFAQMIDSVTSAKASSAAIGASVGAPGSSGSGSSPSAAAASGTAGGTTVSSGMAGVVNNFSVTLPVSALDLQSISDSTMRALAYKVGRYIQEASATGQLGLA